MNIVVAGHVTFPHGGPAASRMRHIAEGLVELGHRVQVICMSPLRWTEDADTKEGWREYNRIPYYLAAGFQPRGRSGIIAKAQVQISMRHGTLEAVRQLKALHRSEGIDALLGYSVFFFAMEPVLRFCRRNGIVIVRDVVELFEPRSFAWGRANPVYWSNWLSINVALPRSDGMIAIS